MNWFFYSLLSHLLLLDRKKTKFVLTIPKELKKKTFTRKMKLLLVLSASCLLLGLCIHLVSANANQGYPAGPWIVDDANSAMLSSNENFSLSGDSSSIKKWFGKYISTIIGLIKAPPQFAILFLEKGYFVFRIFTSIVVHIISTIINIF